MTIVQRNLTVRLLPDEVALKADELAKEMTDLETAEEIAKEAAREARAKLGERRLRIRGLREVVRTHEEVRPVDCRREPDLGRKVWVVSREDTGELVSTNPMTPDEYAREAQLDFERTANRSEA